MVDNNRGRFFLAVEPAYADVEYVFFISSRWYHMLLLTCSLHNCRPHRLDCGGCARVCATSFILVNHFPTMIKTFLIIGCGQTVIQQQLNTAQIGTVYTYIIWVKDKIMGLFFIPFINRLVRFGTFSYRGSTSNRFVRGNLVGIRSHIIRSLSHRGH
jgi:hypothetical protein